jgi:hypothetical protein
MWCDPVGCSLGPRDVIGAWLVCFAVVAVCFLLPSLAVLP